MTGVSSAQEILDSTLGDMLELLEADGSGESESESDAEAEAGPVEEPEEGEEIEEPAALPDPSSSKSHRLRLKGAAEILSEGDILQYLTAKGGQGPVKLASYP